MLWWIRGHSRQFKPFVANRVGEIQADVGPERWRYVPTEKNPADYLTRGTKLVEISELRAWWEGPAFLLEDQCKWPQLGAVLNPEDSSTELKRKYVT